MKISVTYPLPFYNAEVWSEFKPYTVRFCETWNKFPPGIDCVLNVWVIRGVIDDGIMSMFQGLPVVFNNYNGPGFHISAQQQSATDSKENCFEVNFTSRCYFHRSGWLERYYLARGQYGPALYGIADSLDSHHHLCTRGHAYDTDDMKQYPHLIDSRIKEYFQESGEGCLLDWFRSIGRKAYIVSWSGVREVIDRPVETENGWRCGDQSDVLIWDKHSDIYANASDADKAKLHRICYGP